MLRSVALVAGVAELTVGALTPGSHAFRADFLGTTQLKPRSSLVTTRNVRQPTTVVVEPVAPPVTGQSTVLAATVSGSVGTVGGQVQFLVDGDLVGSPRTLSGGRATVTWVPSGPGTKAVTARYLGNGTYRMFMVAGGLYLDYTF